jgi:hypothetical protein
LFQSKHDYRLDCDNNVIYGTTYDNVQHAIPLDIAALNHLLNTSNFSSGELCLYPITCNEWVQIASNNIDRLVPEFSDKDSDYVFERANVLCLRGAKNSHLRAALNHVSLNYTIIAEPITSSRAADAIAVLRNWQAGSKCLDIETDYTECLNGLNNFESLHLTGCIYYLAAQPVGFWLGYLLSRDTFAILFSKSTAMVRELSRYMFFDACSRAEVQYINYGQDLGMPFLSSFKKSLGSSKLLRKLRLRRDVKV